MFRMIFEEMRTSFYLQTLLNPIVIPMRSFFVGRMYEKIEGNEQGQFRIAFDLK